MSGVFPFAARIINFPYNEGKQVYDGPCAVLFHTEYGHGTGPEAVYFVCLLPNGQTIKVNAINIRVLVKPDWKRLMGETELSGIGDVTP
jgi:hypothetical protein